MRRSRGWPGNTPGVKVGERVVTNRLAGALGYGPPLHGGGFHRSAPKAGLGVTTAVNTKRLSSMRSWRC